jgi:hypothetical protein
VATLSLRLQQNRIGRWALLFLVATLLTLPILQVVAPERKLVSNALLLAILTSGMQCSLDWELTAPVFS